MGRVRACRQPHRQEIWCEGACKEDDVWKNVPVHSLSVVRMESSLSLTSPPSVSQPSAGAPLDPELCYLILEK